MLVCKIQNGLSKLSHVTSPNFLGDVISSISDFGQVSSLSDEYNQKRHFISARPEGRFYKNLVWIVLIIGPEIDIIKKSFTTRESRYIELFFHTKIEENVNKTNIHWNPSTRRSQIYCSKAIEGEGGLSFLQYVAVLSMDSVVVLNSSVHWWQGRDLKRTLVSGSPVARRLLLFFEN